jgi:hypothetical protein
MTHTKAMGSLVGVSFNRKLQVVGSVRRVASIENGQQQQLIASET